MPSDDWGFDDRAGKPASGSWGDDTETRMPAGGDYAWHWKLTLLTLIVTSICVFLLHWLLRGEQNFNAVQVGLLFMVPVAAVLLSAFLLEHRTSLMTPRFSRNGQALVALIASVIVFAVGCLGQVSFVSFTYQPDNYIFLVDKSNSMGYGSNNGGSDAENYRKEAFSDILTQLPNGAQVGFVLFSDLINNKYSISPLNAQSRTQMLAVLDEPDKGGTNFILALYEALDMLENNPSLTQTKTNIIYLTDGEKNADIPADTAMADCLRLNAVVSCVKLGYVSIDNDLMRIIQGTEGRSMSIADISTLTQSLSEVSEGESSDVIHNDSESANWIAGILFIITGISLGFALSLMLSRSKEFRFQLILSPLMGAAAFALVKYLRVDVEPWIWTAGAFCLYGLVFMQILYPAKTSADTPDSF